MAVRVVILARLIASDSKRRQALSAAVVALLAPVRGLVEVVAGDGAAAHASTSPYNFGVLCTFKDASSASAFTTHPAHVRLLQDVLRPHLASDAEDGICEVILAEAAANVKVSPFDASATSLQKKATDAATTGAVYLATAGIAYRMLSRL